MLELIGLFVVVMMVLLGYLLCDCLLVLGSFVVSY